MITGRHMLSGIAAISSDIGRIARRQICFYRATPVVATLFLTYRCNSHCKTCTLWKRPAADEVSREIGFPEWKIIIDKLAGAGIRNAELFGGNVLLRKELLIDVLKYLHGKGFRIHVPTNQIGIDDEAAKALASHAECVYISTDGTGEYQDSIRGQAGAYRRVEDAVTRLLSFRSKGTPRLVCNTTVSKYNVDILEALVHYAIGKGFDEIHFEYAGEFSQDVVNASVIEGIRPTPYYIKQEESILVDACGAQRLKETLNKIKKNFAHEKIKIVTLNIDILSEQNLSRGTIPHGKCYVERMEATIDPAGNLVICPFINNYVLGNLLQSSFSKIWNGSAQKTFRNYQNCGAIKMCQHCILGVQRNPGLATSLKRVYLNRIEPKLSDLRGLN